MVKNLQGLQFLRFIAIISVIFAHLPTVQSNTNLAFLVGGGIGVDIFFIISGYIMMHITNDNTKPLNFFTKRFLRIAPLNIFFTLIIFLISYLIIIFPTISNPDVIYHFSSNKLDVIYFFKSIFFVHFFNPPINSIAWSLQNEFLFYTLFTIALFLKINRIVFFIIYSILIILINKFNYNLDNELLKYLFHPIMLEFVLGIFLYKLHSINLLKPTETSLLILIMLIIFFFFGRYDFYTTGVFHRVLTFGMISFNFVYIFLIFENKIKFMKTFIFLGDASYSLYLSHWTLFTFSLFFINTIDKIYYGLYVTFCIFISLLFGVLIYKYIELPIHSFIRKTIKY
jgi:peptidoglycan/LPS O-acetylase OafA/YrhL